MKSPSSPDTPAVLTVVTTPPVVASWERVPPSLGERPKPQYAYGDAPPLLATDPQYVDVYA